MSLDKMSSVKQKNYGSSKCQSVIAFIPSAGISFHLLSDKPQRVEMAVRVRNGSAISDPYCSSSHGWSE